MTRPESLGRRFARVVTVAALAAAAAAVGAGPADAKPDTNCVSATQYNNWINLMYRAAIKRGDKSDARFWHSEIAPAREYRDKVCGT